MTLYRCTQRLKTPDGVIHEVGTTVELSGQEEQSAVRQHAVEAVSMPPAQPTFATAPIAPTLPQLEQERAQLDEQIATMEHEGGN